MSEMRRAFVWSSEAWFNEGATLPCVMFGMYDRNGSTDGEMAMRWYDIGHRLVPRLEVFDNAWGALAGFGDVLEKMSEVDDQDIQPSQFVAMLRSLGFDDITEYENPNEPPF